MNKISRLDGLWSENIVKEALNINRKLILSTKKAILRKWLELANDGYIYRLNLEVVTLLARKVLFDTKTGSRKESQITILRNWLLLSEKEHLNKKRHLFCKLNTKEIDEVCQRISLQKYSPHELLFLQSEMGTSFYIIFSGNMDFYDIDLNKINKDLYLQFLHLRTANDNTGLYKPPYLNKDDLALVLGLIVNKGRYTGSITIGDYFDEVVLMTQDAFRLFSAIGGESGCELLILPKYIFEKSLKHYFQYKVLNESIQFLRTINIFSDWNHNIFPSFAYCLEVVNISRGQIIVEQNSQCDKLFIIWKGWLKLIKLDKCKHPIELSIIGEKNIFGEEFIISNNYKYPYRVTALCDGVVLTLNDIGLRKTNRYFKV